jgi:hypothetical protein
MSASSKRINPSKASLVGGIAVGIASMVLWLAVTRELGFGGALTLAAGLLISIAVAVWTRIADL